MPLFRLLRARKSSTYWSAKSSPFSHRRILNQLSEKQTLLRVHRACVPLCVPLDYLAANPMI